MLSRLNHQIELQWSLLAEKAGAVPGAINGDEHRLASVQ
jgi:hypothetical protein